MRNTIFKAAEDKMQHAIEGIVHELTTIRTGKASPGLLEGVIVDAYGSKMPLNQLSSISAPEARMLIVQPWDKGMIGPIEKAIQVSDLGLTPSNDGNVIRLPVPALNEERRRDLVKLVHKLVEAGRVSVRHARKEANDELKQALKDSAISEDEEHRALDDIQKLTDKYIEKMDEVMKHKEAEIMEI